MNISKLKYPPIKYDVPKKFPDKLVTHKYYDYLGKKIDEFTMFSTKKSEQGKRAIMRCFPEQINRDGMEKVPSLYVLHLFSNCSGSGFGTAMLDFAKIYSKKIGCKGFFHLTSDTAFTPSRIPHPFYRKYGMNTGNIRIDKKLDKFVRSGKDATYQDFYNVEMYYPPIFPKIAGISTVTILKYIKLFTGIG